MLIKLKLKKVIKLPEIKKIATTFILLLKSISRVKTEFSLSPMNNRARQQWKF